MRKWIVFILFIMVLAGCDTPETIKPKKFVVEFVSNSEEVITSIEVTNGTLLESSFLPIPENVDGYVFGGWFVDEEFTTTAERYRVTQNLILYGKWDEVLPAVEEVALANLTIISSTFDDLNLPQKAGEFSLNWYSSLSDVVSDQGKVKRVSEDITVEMTATIVTDNIYERTFLVTVVKYPYEEKFDQVFASIAFPEFIENDVVLSTRFSNSIRGTWSSNKSTIISSSGRVTLTYYEEEVTLTLTLELDKQTATSTFVLRTKAAEATIQDPEYFINQLSKKDVDVNAPIMTGDEISSFNQTVINTSSANTIDMAAHPEQIGGHIVRGKMTIYSAIDKYAVYEDGTGRYLNREDIDLFLANCDLDGIPQTVNVRYAVSTTHTVLRGYATHNYADTYTMDRIQETGFSAGTPMIIYHTSLDQKWYYVRMFHYDGWVPAESVGVCNREDFLKFVNPENFIVVLDNFLKIENQSLRMGTKIPHLGKTGASYRVAFPKRGLAGELVIQEVLLADTLDVSDGYIPYTYTNLLTQAYKFVGIPYSWGDKTSYGLDCSSTQAAVYACFGFVLGRNTSNQRVTNIYGKNVTNLTNERLKEYPVGTLLYTRSHVMMYIGVDKDGNCWLLHNTSSGNICKLETLNSYGTTGISWTLGLYK